MAYYNGNKIISNGRLDLNSPYYEFTKREYEKSANLYYGETQIGALSIEKPGVSTGTTRMTSGIYYEVKPNTKYSISIEGLEDITYVTYTNEKVFVRDHNWQYSNKITIITGNDAGYIRFAFRYSDNREITSKNEISNIMFNEGEPLPYQEWNGYPLHPKDIEPVLIWKNSTPNVAFNAQSPNLTKEVKVGDILETCYKMNTTSGSKIEQVYINELGKYCRLIDASTNIRYREITPNGNTVYFGSGFLNGEQNDEVMIPLWIKLRRY